MIFDIVIIGAGASGLAAAYRIASRSSQLKILVIEKENIPGRKLSASGNGKCNLTNAHFQADCYHSENTAFIKKWIADNSYEEIPAFFEGIGILLYQNNGYFYPLSNQGKQVTGLLYQKSVNLGVRYIFDTRVTAIHTICSKHQLSYKIDAVTNSRKAISLDCQTLILSTGGAAFPKLGGCRDGYYLSSSLKLKQTPVYPVLSPIYVEDPFLPLAKGVRLDASVTLKNKEGVCMRESGQVQINDKSLSGIVIMNLSSYLNKWPKEELKECLSIDVLPDLSWDSLKKFFLNQKNNNIEESLVEMLSGILPVPFVDYLIKRLRLDKNIQLSNLTEKQINRLTSSLKKLVFTPTGYEDYDKAQATGGGVATEEINVHTFESIQYKNLYLTGELLDVNGKCGGYNLTFAILSGITAADHIVDTNMYKEGSNGKNDRNKRNQGSRQ